MLDMDHDERYLTRRLEQAESGDHDDDDADDDVEATDEDDDVNLTHDTLRLGSGVSAVASKRPAMNATDDAGGQALAQQPSSLTEENVEQAAV